MIDLKTKVVMYPKRVTDAVDKAAFRNLGHAGARIRKDAQASIVKAEGPSAAGTPPHTHRGKFLSRAIRFDYDKQKQQAVIGPRKSVVGTAGHAHEMGGLYKGQIFPERPFMLPALERNLPRMSRDWEGSIGE